VVDETWAIELSYIIEAEIFIGVGSITPKVLRILIHENTLPPRYNHNPPPLLHPRFS